MNAIRRTTTVLTTSLLACALGAAPALADDHEPAVPAGARTAPAAALAGRTAAAVPADQIPAVLTRTASRSRYLSTQLSGMTMDPATGAVSWSYRSGQSRMPASDQKLLTTYAVLHSMSADTTFTTRVMQRNNPGSVFLVGQGDPSLTPTRLADLARDTARRMRSLHRDTVSVSYDAGYFPLNPTTAFGWPGDALSGDVQLVRGLALAGYRGGDSSRAAADVFARALEDQGVHASVRGRATTPAGSRTVAASASAPVGSLLGQMLNASDNDYAEFLLQQAARARGYLPGRYAAVVNLRRLLAASHIPTTGLTSLDASGLSHADRVAPLTLAAVVRSLWNDPATRAVAFAPDAMPRSGQSGTLYNRFHDPVSSCATGRVLAKTGTLSDAVTLTGIARGVDGRDRIFVLLQNGATPRDVTRLAVDHLAATVVGCHA